MHVITGASGGLGRAVAEALASQGAPVLAVARRADVLDELASGHSSLEVLAGDVTSAEDRRRLRDRCRGPVESIVHGAGSRVAVQAMSNVSADELADDMESHIAAVLALTGDLADGPGLERMVVFDSYSATTPRVGWAAYSVVKAGAQMVARAVDAEYPDVDVLRLYPGAVRTPLLEAMLGSQPSPARETYRGLDRAGSVAEPAEIGRWVADLLRRPRTGSFVAHFDDQRRRPEGPLDGGCLCGAIRYRLTGRVRDVIECHCERCRRHTGHHMAATSVDRSGWTVVDDATLRWFAPADDPNVEYGFCSSCGSTLFWRVAESTTVSVAAGTLDPPTGLRTIAAGFVRDAHDYVRIDHTVPSAEAEPDL